MQPMELRVVLVFGAAGLLAHPAAAQTPEFHYRQGGQIEGVFFLNDMEGWTAEDGGRIRYTQDGGDTWFFGEVPSDVRGELRGIYFIDGGVNDPIGWAVGDGGVCLKSTDGGLTWTWINSGSTIMNTLTTPTPARLWDIHMIDADDGWAVGEDGAFARTSNSGISWGLPGSYTSPLGSGGDPTDAYRLNIFDSDPDHIIVAADKGHVFRTDDGGETWDTLLPHAFATDDVCPDPIGHNFEYWDITFDDPSDPDTGGWLAGGIGQNQGFVFRFEDGGDTWTQTRCYEGNAQNLTTTCGLPTIYGVAALGSDPEASFVGYAEVVFAWESGTANFDPCLCDDQVAMECASESPIWVQHNDTNVPVAPPLHGIAKISSSEACIVGTFGIIRRFLPGAGTEFVNEGTVDYNRITDGDFVDDDVGCVTIQNLLIKRTEDGGLTWDLVYSPTLPDTRIPHAIEFGPDGQTGVAVGEDGWVVRTEDAGETWTVEGISHSSTFRAVAFADADTVYIGGVQGKVYRSDDGGDSWTAKYLPGGGSTNVVIYGASFANEDDGYVVGHLGSNTIAYVTANGGSTWTTVSFTGGTPEGILYDVATWDDGASAIAVASQGRVYERTGGGNFVQLTTPAPALDLSDVEVLFDDPDLDVIVTGTGGFVMFRDPSNTWTTPKSQTIDPLVKASFQSPTHGFIIGNQFLICEYE